MNNDESMIYQYLASTGPHTAKELRSALFPSKDIDVVHASIEKLKSESIIEQRGETKIDGVSAPLFRLKPKPGTQDTLL